MMHDIMTDERMEIPTIVKKIQTHPKIISFILFGNNNKLVGNKTISNLDTLKYIKVTFFLTSSEEHF